MRLYRVVYSERYGGNDALKHIDLVFDKENINSDLMYEIDEAMNYINRRVDDWTLINIIPLEQVAESTKKLYNDIWLK